MIVRILNQKENRDSFYDCRNCCLKELSRNSSLDPEEFVLIFEFSSDESIEVVLGRGDEIYYMNDSGKTVHANHRVANVKGRQYEYTDGNSGCSFCVHHNHSDNWCKKHNKKTVIDQQACVEFEEE